MTYDPPNPIQGELAGTHYANTFSESDVTVTYTDTEVASESIKLTDGSSISRTADNNSTSESGGRGMVVNPNTDVSSIEVTISGNMGTVQDVYVTDSSENILTEKTAGYSSGDTVTLNASLSSGNDYYVGVYDDGASYTLGYYNSPSFPYTSTDFDVTGEVNNCHPNDGTAASTGTALFYAFSDIVVPDATSGDALIENTNGIPQALDQYEVVRFGKSPDGETVTVDIQEPVTTYYDLTAFSYRGNTYDITGQDTDPQGIELKGTGGKLYMIGYGSNTVYQYSITGTDVTTISYDNTSYSASESSTSRGVRFGDSGKKMYIADSANSDVHQYTLSTGYDLSTASFDTSLNVANENGGDIQGIAIDSTGNNFYTAGRDAFAYKYDLSTAYDLGTASVGNSLDFSSETSKANDIAVRPDGSEIFLPSSADDKVFMYELSTANDLSTASYSGESYDHSGEDTAMSGIVFDSDGSDALLQGSPNVFGYDCDGTGHQDLLTDVSSGDDLSSISPSKEIKPRVNLSRNDTSNNPTLDWIEWWWTREHLV